MQREQCVQKHEDKKVCDALGEHSRLRCKASVGNSVVEMGQER